MSLGALGIAHVALCLGQADATSVTPAHVVIELRPQFPIGRSLVYRITEKQVIADQAEGATAIHTTSVVLLSLTSVASTEDGSRLQARVERVQWTVRGPGQPVSFDSSLPKARAEPKEFSTFREMLNRHFDVTINGRGRVLDVAPAISVDGDPRLAGTANIRRWMEMLSAWLPDEAVGLRDDWQREESLSVGIVEMLRKNRLRVVKTDSDRAIIEGQIELSGRSADGIKDGTDRLMASIVAAAPGKSTIVFNRSLGAVEQIESRVAFEMRVIRIPAAEDQTPVVSAQRLSASAVIELLEENLNSERRSGRRDDHGG